MFGTISLPGPGPSGSKKACDQCKQRKVRCDGAQPCHTCVQKSFTCSYDRVVKKRGPSGKKNDAIGHQQSTLEDNSPHSSPARANPPAARAQHVPDQNDLMGSFMVSDPSPGTMSFPNLPPPPPASSLFTTFGSMPQGTLPAEIADVSPARVSAADLLTWVDVYFARLHPTIPILDREDVYRQIELQKHLTDSHYGAMLLSLRALGMTQPAQTEDRPTAALRSAEAQELVKECVQMRATLDFGEHPTIDMIRTSFFLFAYLCGNHQYEAARHKIREATDLARSLGMHLPQSYTVLTPELSEQWLRTYLVLSVAEKAFALQQSNSISANRLPSVTARFMHAFDPHATSVYISLLTSQHHPASSGTTALLYLTDTFNAIDETVANCWNGYCKYSDGACEAFDKRRALQMFRGQYRAHDACAAGYIMFAPSVELLPVSKLPESQRIDISVTQLWIHGRLWQLCLTHGVLRKTSEHPELRYDFAGKIARVLLTACNDYSLDSMEVLGLGLMEKIYDVAMGLITAIRSGAGLHVDSVIPTDADPLSTMTTEFTVRELLHGLASIMGLFRGGDHRYNAQFAGALVGLPGLHE